MLISFPAIIPASESSNTTQLLGFEFVSLEAIIKPSGSGLDALTLLPSTIASKNPWRLSLFKMNLAFLLEEYNAT